MRVFLLFVLIAPAASAQSGDDLVGRWTVDTIIDAEGNPALESQGITALEFFAGGSLSVTLFNEADVQDRPRHRYQVTADTLRIDLYDGEHIFDTSSGRFEIDGDRMVLVDLEQGSTAYLTRGT